MVGKQFFAHASDKNFESLDDILDDSLNVAKNKYSVNQVVDVGRMDANCNILSKLQTRLRYKDIRYQHNRVKKILPILFGGKL